jgi:hypothetical protein
MAYTINVKNLDAQTLAGSLCHVLTKHKVSVVKHVFGFFDRRKLHKKSLLPMNDSPASAWGHSKSSSP